MNHVGLGLASRYSYPPNSFSLCGPEKQSDLGFYTSSQDTDAGTTEILKEFSTMYPYFCFIAGENRLKDEFDPKVVEAYWLGNSLLKATKSFDFLQFLDDNMKLPAKLSRDQASSLKNKVAQKQALPHHAFHVLNVYTRTGHLDIPQTVATMDACIINWGTVCEIVDTGVIVKTKPLTMNNNLLGFHTTMKRKLKFQGDKDLLKRQLKAGDIVSYHWGYVCEKLNYRKLRNLEFYTNKAVNLANAS